jgi:hypothetical protein
LIHRIETLKNKVGGGGTDASGSSVPKRDDTALRTTLLKSRKSGWLSYSIYISFPWYLNETLTLAR